MKFALWGKPATKFLEEFARGVQDVFEKEGHRRVDEVSDETKLVLNFADANNPQPYRRQSRAIFIVSLLQGKGSGDEEGILKHAYPYLVRTLSNLLLYFYTDSEGEHRTFFITLERGAYEAKSKALSPEYFAEVYRRLAPLALSNLVIENIFEPDLPEKLWQGTEATEDIKMASRRFAELDLLPAPFPLEEILDPRDLRHIKKLYGLGGLSYGNLSARHDERSFWMSASGVDKTRLQTVGRDILLVKDFSKERNAMVIGAVPGIEPRRVSVDAIEHWFIYMENPEVGAILHLHAWMDNITTTDINYPCGTFQLARSVADIVKHASDPARTVVGLRNHGLTITGRNLKGIFDRIEGHLIRQVPMT